MSGPTDSLNEDLKAACSEVLGEAFTKVIFRYISGIYSGRLYKGDDPYESYVDAFTEGMKAFLGGSWETAESQVLSVVSERKGVRVKTVRELSELYRKTDGG